MLKNPIARVVTCAVCLLVGYKALEVVSDRSYADMARTVPRVRTMELDPIFDHEVEWRRRLGALDAFCHSHLRRPAPEWAIAAADAAARLLRLRNALVMYATDSALPPVTMQAARVCATRIFECMTAIESIVLEIARRAMHAPDMESVSQLLQGVTAHEINSGVIIDTMPRDVIELYKRTTVLAQELKEVLDNEIMIIDRLRAMRAANGVQYTSHVHDAVLLAMHDAFALEYIQSKQT